MNMFQKLLSNFESLRHSYIWPKHTVYFIFGNYQQNWINLLVYVINLFWIDQSVDFAHKAKVHLNLA